MGNIYIPPKSGGSSGFAKPDDIEIKDGLMIIDWLLPDGKHIKTSTAYPEQKFNKYKGYLTDDKMYSLDTSSFTGGEFCFNHSIEYGVYMYEFVVEGDRREWTQDATANWISRNQLEKEGIILKSYATRFPKAGDFIFKSEQDKILVYNWNDINNNWDESGEISHSFHSDFFVANKMDGGFKQINENGFDVNVHKIATTPNSQMIGDPRSKHMFIGSNDEIIQVNDDKFINFDISNKTTEHIEIPLRAYGTFKLTLDSEFIKRLPTETQYDLMNSRAIRPTKVKFNVDKLFDKHGDEIEESVLWFAITDITNPDKPKLIFRTSSITGLSLGIGAKINKGLTEISIDTLNYLLMGNTYELKMCCQATQLLSGEIFEGSFLPNSNLDCETVKEYSFFTEKNLTNNKIRDMLSELKGDERLDASHIKNLPDYPDIHEFISELRLTEQKVAILGKSVDINIKRQRLQEQKIAIIDKSIRILNSK